mgnify:CR=1 FL=1
MSSTAGRMVARNARAHRQRLVRAMSVDPVEPEAWMVPTAHLDGPSPDGPGLDGPGWSGTGDAHAPVTAGQNPLRRTAAAMPGAVDQPAIASIPAPVLARLRRTAGTVPSSTESTHGSPGPAAPGSVLRRRITATSADIAANRRKKGKLAKLTGSKDSLDKIGKLLDGHAALTDQQAQITSLAAIVTLIDKWLNTHSDEKDRGMVSLLEDIKAEASRDLGQARAQQRYLNDLRAGELMPNGKRRLEHQPTKTPFTQQLTAEMASKASRTMALTGQQWDDGDRRKPVADLIRSAGLSEAEIAAIKIFTANDFLYINPTVANNPEWMQGQMKDVSAAMASSERFAGPRKLDQVQLHQEGVTHGGILMQALMKLPPEKGEVYRGARMNAEEFAEAYGGKSQLTYDSFVSSAFKSVASDVYARGGGAKKPRPDQTISVKCIFEVQDARDVRKLSEVAVEEEWVLLPGTTFAITSIEDDTVKEVGTPPATAWKVVHLKQIPRPASPSKTAPAGAAAKAGGAPDLSSPAARALAQLARGNFAAPAAQTAPPAESSLQAMQRLGRRDFSTAGGRQRG